MIHYIKSELKPSKIGIHGESLGGSVACFLAKKCGLDFLFADRTFSSLAETGYFRFGKACYWALRLFLKSDSDTVADFLGTRCYKVMSAGFNDKIIPDLASLKSGVALRFIYPNYSALSLSYLDPKLLQTTHHILTAAEICNLVGSLNSLSKEDKNNEITKVLDKFDSVNAAGKAFSHVLQDESPFLSFLI